MATVALMAMVASIKGDKVAHELVIAVGGGVAAYKSAALVSKLAQRGHSVTVVMTRAARHFVGPTTFAALSGRPVVDSMWASGVYPLGPHIELARAAELLCVAPATANILAQAAGGLANDLLSTLLLSFTGATILAPAMNSEMWAKKSVQRNVEQCQADGFHIVGPESGWLSCRDQGAGRMVDPEVLLAEIEKRLG